MAGLISHKINHHGPDAKMGMLIEGGVVAFIAFIGIWLVLSVVSNIIVIVIVAKSKKMRTVTNLLICNLALSDIFLGVFILPQNLHDLTHTEDYFEGDFSCRVVNALPIYCIMNSICTMVMMSVERYRVIVVTSKITLQQAVKAIVAIFIIAVATCVPTIIEYSEYTIAMTLGEGGNVSFNSTLLNATRNTTTVHRLRCGSNSVSHTFSIANGFFLLVIAYILPLIIIVTNYIRLGSFLWSRARVIKHGTSQVNSFQQSNALARKVRVVKMLLLVAVLFALCWMPYFVLLLIAKMTGADDSADLNGVVNMIRLTLSVFSTSYNTVLYVIYNTQFREGFKSILCGCSICHRCSTSNIEILSMQATTSSERRAPDRTGFQGSFRTDWTMSGPVRSFRTGWMMPGPLRSEDEATTTNKQIQTILPTGAFDQNIDEESGASKK